MFWFPVFCSLGIACCVTHFNDEITLFPIFKFFDRKNFPGNIVVIVSRCLKNAKTLCRNSFLVFSFYTPDISYPA
jgi:hypothetical protein